jgi:hypothetical protein
MEQRIKRPRRSLMPFACTRAGRLRDAAPLASRAGGSVTR